MSSSGEWTGLLVLGLVGVIVSIAMHVFVRGYWQAAALSAVVASLSFQAIQFFRQGYFDPFAIIALVFGAGAVFVISLIVGLPFRWVRR